MRQLPDDTLKIRPLTRRSFLKTMAVAASGTLGTMGYASAETGSSDNKSKQPNILFILADDLGWNDVGYHGSEIMTPNIDALAKEGVVFDQHYVMASCSPTRCGLLTGQYPSRFGRLTPPNDPVLPPGQRTLASALKEAGYETYLSGKWHLGSSPAVGPYKYGFDHSYGSLAGGVTPYGHRYKKGPYSKTWHRDGTYIKEEGHVTDLLGQEVVRSIHQSKQSPNPFFIYVPFTAPHHPIQEEQKWLDLYTDTIENESRRRYAACVTHMDAMIGEFIRALEETGQRENTIVIFASDNGAEHGYRFAGKYPGIDESFSTPVEGDNDPLHGWKLQLYEGGIRVPALIHWPAELKSGKVKHPVHIVDWMPTLCSVAKCEMSDTSRLDGQNIWPIITGRDAHDQQRTFYWRTTRQMALRKGDWKLIVNMHKKNKTELYNLQNDPLEKHDLSEKYPEKVEKLYSLLEKEKARDNNRTSSNTV